MKCVASHCFFFLEWADCRLPPLPVETLRLEQTELISRQQRVMESSLSAFCQVFDGVIGDEEDELL